jgi:hypothetical protein
MDPDYPVYITLNIALQTGRKEERKMSGSLKLGLMLLAGVVAASIVIKIAASLISLLMPLIIVLGVGLVIYGLINRRALGSGGRRLLP